MVNAEWDAYTCQTLVLKVNNSLPQYYYQCVSAIIPRSSFYVIDDSGRAFSTPQGPNSGLFTAKLKCFETPSQISLWNDQDSVSHVTRL
jgi:hypothetical protein